MGARLRLLRARDTRTITSSVGSCGENGALCPRHPRDRNPLQDSWTQRRWHTDHPRRRRGGHRRARARLEPRLCSMGHRRRGVALVGAAPVPAEYRQRGQSFVVRRHTIDYLRPSVLGDRIVVETRVRLSAGTTSERETVMKTADAGLLVAHAHTYGRSSGRSQRSTRPHPRRHARRLHARGQEVHGEDERRPASLTEGSSVKAALPERPWATPPRPRAWSAGRVPRMGARPASKHEPHHRRGVRDRTVGAPGTTPLERGGRGLRAAVRRKGSATFFVRAAHRSAAGQALRLRRRRRWPAAASRSNRLSRTSFRPEPTRHRRSALAAAPRRTTTARGLEGFPGGRESLTDYLLVGDDVGASQSRLPAERRTAPGGTTCSRAGDTESPLSDRCRCRGRMRLTSGRSTSRLAEAG